MRLKNYIFENIRDDLIKRDMMIDDDRFPVILDTIEKNIAYFPLFNLSGKFVGYQ